MAGVNTRDRIKQQALALFAERGYARTSIGAIEEAAGLAPRAGAFYRHFDSKAALLEELARSSISETPEEFDFAGLAALRDTRAELVSIAQTYERAVRRQAPYRRLIEEIRVLEGGAEFEEQINEELLDALMTWTRSKPAGRRLSRARLAALTLNVFGAWLFYLTKLAQGIDPEPLDRDVFLDAWASHWAAALDG